jgi:hypothetical protein
MRKRNVCGLLLCVTLVFCFVLPPTAHAASAEEEVLQIVTNFVKALNENDAELLSSLLYQPPIKTSFGRRGRLPKHERFPNPPPRVSFSLSHPQVTMIGDDVAVIIGYFTVSTANPETNEISIEYLRDSLVVQKIHRKWLIIHHEHSSYQP